MAVQEVKAEPCPHGCLCGRGVANINRVYSLVVEGILGDLLSPTNVLSEEEAEPEDFGLGSPITGVEVARAVKQLHSGSDPGVDEICP